MAVRKAAGPASKKAATATPAVNGIAKPNLPTKAATKAPARSPPSAAAKAPVKPVTKPAAKPATKASTKTTTISNAANMSKKRKIAENEQEEEPKTNGVKRARTATKSATPAPATTQPKPAAKKTPVAKTSKDKSIINEAPSHRLDVYVFGQGENAELGLGSEKNQLEVKRPRLNPLLAADKVGVVAISVGGMHTAVLTHDNKILTWGVNDQGALGRDTKWEGGLRDIDDDKSDSDSDSDSSDAAGPNPLESTPGEVDVSALPENLVWTQLACTDSATFALTDHGLVYGWGTFRDPAGLFGFRPTPDGMEPETEEKKIERRPMLVERVKDVTQLAAGDNHVLALTKKGEVYAWGAGQQNQLGRRILERTRYNSLIPTGFGLKKDVVLVGAGAFHSFAVQKSGKVLGWGLNSFGQTGLAMSPSDVHNPAVVKSLSKFGKVVDIDGGSHHTVAVTDKGELLVWGRMDGCQSGLDVSTIPDAHILRDSINKPSALKVPTQIPGIDALQAAAGSDHCVAVAKDGKAYAWGFSALYQTGLGKNEDVPIATHIDNTATRGKQLVQAGCGGQFSALVGLAGVSTVAGA